MKKMLRRLSADIRGDDLIEYVLLATFLGLATLLAFQLTGISMRSVYQGWDSAAQDRWDLNADLTPANSSGP